MFATKHGCLTSFGILDTMIFIPNMVTLDTLASYHSITFHDIQ